MQRPNENIGLWYHQLSKDLTMGGQVKIPLSYKDWPDNWINVDYKEYKNTEVIKLPDLNGVNTNFDKLDEVLKKRKSRRDFGMRQHSITLLEIGILCKLGFGEFKNNSQNEETEHYENNFRRTHPSGGPRYSLEYYIFVNRSNDLERGIYHYNIRNNSLELLESFVGKGFPQICILEWAQDAAVCLFMTSIFDRNMRKYKERGYRYVLQESGHVGQNVYLLATSLGLSVCSFGGTKDGQIEEILGVEGINESLVYTMLIG